MGALGALSLAAALVLGSIGGLAVNEDIGPIAYEQSASQDSAPVASYRLFLEPSPDSQHITLPVRVGTPPQTIQVVLDTVGDSLALYTRAMCLKEQLWSNMTCFNGKASSTAVELAETLGRFHIEMDGTRYDDNSTQPFNDTVSIAGARFSLDVGGSSSLQNLALRIALMSNLTDINVPRWPSPHAGGLRRVAGFFGLNPFSPGGRRSALARIAPGQPPVFALEFSDPAVSKSEVHVGGVDAQYQGLVWYTGVTATDPNTGFALFSISGLEVCGQELTMNSSTPTPSHPAIVDTRSACLGLPPWLFDATFSRLPVQCTGDGVQRYCYLPSGLDPRLPALGFRIGVSGGDMVRIPLTDLLLGEAGSYAFVASQAQDPAPYDRRFCVVRGANDDDPVRFGSRALRRIYTVLDARQSPGRVGMAVSLAAATEVGSTGVQCVADVPCTGMQTLNKPGNTCEDPDCSLYYFLEMREEDKTCVLTNTFHILAGFIVAVFVGVEIALDCTHARLTKAVRDGLQPLNDDPRPPRPRRRRRRDAKEQARGYVVRPAPGANVEMVEMGRPQIE